MSTAVWEFPPHNPVFFVERPLQALLTNISWADQRRANQNHHYHCPPQYQCPKHALHVVRLVTNSADTSKERRHIHIQSGTYRQNSSNPVIQSSQSSSSSLWGQTYTWYPVQHVHIVHQSLPFFPAGICICIIIIIHTHIVSCPARAYHPSHVCLSSQQVFHGWLTQNQH